MPKYTYDVVLQTQLGYKPGKMTLTIDKNNICGVITILGYSMPCSGEIDSEEHYSLRGQLKTFMSVIDYSGTGYVDNQSVDFKLSDNKNCFHLFGTVCQSEV